MNRLRFGDAGPRSDEGIWVPTEAIELTDLADGTPARHRFRRQNKGVPGSDRDLSAMPRGEKVKKR